MGRYGNGITMKSVMLMEYNRVKLLLNSTNINIYDKGEILEILKNAFFEWANTNAHACLEDELVGQLLTEENRVAFARACLALAPGYIEKKMAETFPWYASRPGEIEDGES